MKAKSKNNMQFFTNGLQVDSFDQEVKFDLFIQSRRVKQITTALDKIYLEAHEKNDKDFEWLKQHPDFIEELIQELLDDSLLVLDGVKLDRESLDLSMRLMSDVRKALGVVQQLSDHHNDQAN